MFWKEGAEVNVLIWGLKSVLLSCGHRVPKLSTGLWLQQAPLIEVKMPGDSCTGAQRWC